MDTIKCIKTRRSIRKFTGEKVSHDVIREIVDAASYAPSWKNTQITRYIVVEDEALKNKIAEDCVMNFSFNTKNIKGAPQLVVVTYRKGICGYERDGSFTTSKGDKWQNFDTGIATQTFCLAAHEKGVATVILGVFDDKDVAEALNLPDDREVAALIAMGYAEGDAPDAPARKSVDELLEIR